MIRAVIGICTPVEQARWSHWDRPAIVLARDYVEMGQRAGALVVLLPPDRTATEDPEQLLDLVDGLVLAGGADVSPEVYGAPRHPKTDPGNRERDEFETALARRALERDLPLLGICRGMQIMNVAAGGTLIQDLPEHHGHEEHRRRLGTFEESDHPVRLAEGSLAARAAGELEHATKSHHHQGVDRIGAGFVVSGWALMDDLPEAIEAPDRTFALGVQWHPEADERSRLIAALVEEAAARRAAAPR